MGAILAPCPGMGWDRTPGKADQCSPRNLAKPHRHRTCLRGAPHPSRSGIPPLLCKGLLRTQMPFAGV